MTIVDALRRGLGAAALAVLAVNAGASGDALATARELAKEEKWAEVAAALEEHLRFQLATREIDDLMGAALANLGRRDEAAHYLERALRATPENDKQFSKLKKRLIEVDALFTRREALMKKIARDLLQSASDLEADGHPARAREILERIQPLALGPEKAGITALLDKIRSSNEEVDLDEAGGSRPEDGWPVQTIESQRYVLRAALELPVAQLLGDTMDSIFDAYVEIYFDGDEKKINPKKATIFVHSSHAEMMKHWQGPPNPGIGGWWSPGEWVVHAYDTRPSDGNLDQMLSTLFHEASHHFMTMLERGGNTPAWLNEGTATFFEGASAMADGRVLWPDAAKDRLRGLEFMLKASSDASSQIPTFLDVISFDQPGSYPGPYYEFGWGIVYYLQQYEDPTSLEYVYRPLYNTYRNEIIQKGGSPRELFERVFVGAASPRGHKTLLEFEKDWKTWILTQVAPLHFGADRRELRMSAVQRYTSAAKLAASDKKARVKERELLLRALGHLDFVRTKIDALEEPDPAVLQAQADVLERVDQGSSAAPIVEQLLDLAASGLWPATEAEVEALVKRLAKLDRKNSALRVAKARTKSLARTAAGLLEDYRAVKPAMLLRSYTLAALFAVSLDNDTVLSAAAAELRQLARGTGVLKGSTFKLDGPEGSWKTIHSNPADEFSVKPERVIIEGVRPVGRLCTAVPVSGEYEFRARVTREGEARASSHHGLVVCGTEAGDWIVATVTKEGRVMLKRLLLGKTGGVTDIGLDEFVNLKRVPPLDKPFDFIAKVLPEGKVEITIDGEGPYPFNLPFTPPATCYVGVYVKHGRLLVDNAVVEILP